MSVDSIAPPPLPVSPPPTLISTGHIDEDEDDEYNDSDSNRGEDEVEVEVGVAALMDSCQSEMVLIHNISQGTPQKKFNSSLIVREDSTLTIDSEDTATVLKDNSGNVTPNEQSRDATPCFDIRSDETPVYHKNDLNQSDLNMTGNTLTESVIDSTLSGDGTLESRARSQDDGSESETEASGVLCKTDETTSDVVELVTGSFENEGDFKQYLESVGTGVSEQDTLDSTACSVVKYTDSEDNENDVVNKGDEMCESNEQNSDTSEEEDLDDEDIKRLEKKYLDLQEDEDEEQSNSDCSEAKDQNDLEENFESTEEFEDLEKTDFVESFSKPKSNVMDSSVEVSDKSKDGNSDENKRHDHVKTTQSLQEEKDDQKEDESEESDVDEMPDKEDPCLTTKLTLQPWVSKLYCFCVIVIKTSSKVMHAMW